MRTILVLQLTIFHFRSGVVCDTSWSYWRRSGPAVGMVPGVCGLRASTCVYLVLLVGLVSVNTFATFSSGELRVFYLHGILVGSVKVNCLSYRYRADKSTIFGMRGLWGLTINSGRGAMLKSQETKMAAFLDIKGIISASMQLRKTWLGSKLGDSGPRNQFMWVPNSCRATIGI